MDASQLHYFFSPGELNDVYIYFPDPWPKKRAWKHRLIQTEFLEVLWSLQAPGSRVEIKTDDRPYFDWILERAEASKYFPERTSFDLHRSEWAAENYQTHFEKLWTRKGLPTHYLRLRRNLAPKGVTHA